MSYFQFRIEINDSSFSSVKVLKLWEEFEKLEKMVIEVAKK